jgi:alcohol dehydrogenase
MLPHVIKMNAESCGELYGELVRLVRPQEDQDPAALLFEWLQKAKKKADMPLRLRECSVIREELPALASEAAEQWTGHYNPKPVAKEDFLRLYQGAY